MAEWGIPLAVGGLLLATLLMASVVNRYQQHQATVRARVRHIETGLVSIQGALDALGMVPLSKEIRVALRSDVLARYQKIRQVYRKYPAVVERIGEAEVALQSEGAPVDNDVGPIDSEQVFRSATKAIDELMEILQANAMIQKIPVDVRRIFYRELGERRAEVLSRFHLVAANRLQGEGDAARARAHVTTLLQVLRKRGPSTDFVRALYQEAESALEKIGQGLPLDEELPGEQKPAGRAIG